MRNKIKNITFKSLILLLISVAFCEHLNSQNTGPLQFSSNPQNNRIYNSSQVNTNNSPSNFTIAKNKTAIKTSVDGFSSEGIYTTKDKIIGFVLKLQNT
jgi:hypothetical protein